MRGLLSRNDQLRRLLERRKSTDPLAVAYIPSLEQETYRQGLSVLADARALREAIESSDKERLQAEIIELESEIGSLSKDETEATRVQLRVDQLLHQAACCEASLDRTRMELASLKADSAEANVSAVTETLRRTINQAREVQEELKGLGF